MASEINKIFGRALLLKDYLGEEKETKVYDAQYLDKNVQVKVVSRKNLKDFNQILIEIGFIKYLSQYVSSQKYIYGCRVMKLTDDYLYLVMDKPTGQTLNDLFKNLKLSDWNVYYRVVTMIMFRLLLGINYIHKKGVAHRGINPETIYVSYKDELVEDLRLSDFAASCGKYIGLPLRKGQKGAYHKLCQTIDLGLVSPPEDQKIDYLVNKIKKLSKDQTRNSIYLYLAKKADIWSLGILFWKLLNRKSLNINNNPLDVEFPKDYQKNNNWKKYHGQKNKLMEGIHKLVVKMMLSEIPNRSKSHEILETFAIHYKYFEEN